MKKYCRMFLRLSGSSKMFILVHINNDNVFGPVQFQNLMLNEWGYGRLGHTEQKDEMVPRLVKLFDFPGRGAAQIYCGYQCSFAVNETGKCVIPPWGKKQAYNTHHLFVVNAAF